MNYLQHNKNQIPNNGPIIAKNLDGKTASQATLHHQAMTQPAQKRIGTSGQAHRDTNLFAQTGAAAKKAALGGNYNNNEFAP